MGKIHFLKVDECLVGIESAELSEQYEAALKACGRPDDKVIILQLCSWLGSVEINEAL
tara:strand:- start:811 stop:984 length:174 start_codon:yes stop_codon:yes gene_type:complete